MSAGPLFGGPSLDFNSMALPRQVNLNEDIKQDLRQAKREIELLKTMVHTIPFCICMRAHLVKTGPFPRRRNVSGDPNGENARRRNYCCPR